VGVMFALWRDDATYQPTRAAAPEPAPAR